LGYNTSIPRNITRKLLVSFFFFYSSKLDNRRAEQVLPGGGLVSVGEGRRWENDERG
jgi:hypothetical protein